MTSDNNDNIVIAMITKTITMIQYVINSNDLREETEEKRPYSGDEIIHYGDEIIINFLWRDVIHHETSVTEVKHGPMMMMEKSSFVVHAIRV